MDVLLIVARAGLALVFIAAGIAKLLDPRGSRAALEGFGISARLAAVGTWVLPIVELAAAAALLTRPTAGIGAALALILLVAFSVGVANALRQGRAPDCHCFGRLHSAPAGRGTIVRNGVLAVPALLVIVAGPGDALVGSGGVQASALVAVSAIAAALAVATTVMLRETHRLGPPASTALPEPLELGSPAPELRLRDAAGRTLSIAEVVDTERPSVLVFVHPGCGACKALLPRLERWRPALEERVALLVISGGAERIGRSEEEPSTSPQVLWDLADEAMGAYRLLGTPSAVHINPDRSIASAPALGNQAIEALIRVARQRRRPARRNHVAA